MPFDHLTDAIDALLIGVVVQIELTDRDRRVTERRYATLDEHLHRSRSPLRPYLVDGASRIYAQGSKAIGATIVHGTGDDRFDLDAVVEFPAPPWWTPGDVLDRLAESLQGFPDALGIERCTRCVQLRFAFMHLDVTPLDPWREPRPERAGDICHAPDEGAAERVASNPYGFAMWFRERVAHPPANFRQRVADFRAVAGRTGILTLGHGQVRADAEVDPLPRDNEPPRDAPQVIALKLLKRFLYRRYASRASKRPPSVFLSKVAAQVPPSNFGLCDQLLSLASAVRTRVQIGLADGGELDERNPRLDEERFTDRWPASRCDLEILREDLIRLENSIRTALESEVERIIEIFGDLFGENASKGALTGYNKIVDRAGGVGRYRRGVGHIAAPAIGVTLASERSTSHAASHRFHPGRIPK